MHKIVFLLLFGITGIERAEPTLPVGKVVCCRSICIEASTDGWRGYVLEVQTESGVKLITSYSGYKQDMRSIREVREDIVWADKVSVCDGYYLFTDKDGISVLLPIPGYKR
jgi:hypothetical protein